MSTDVLFVCLGNICRSPTAHGVFEKMVAEAGFIGEIRVESAGTGNWHIGERPDPRSTQAAAARGYKLDHLRAREFVSSDFQRFDYILAMDHSNLSIIKSKQPANFTGEVGLFLAYAPNLRVDEVPDPYYGGEKGFDNVLDMVEAASRGLLKQICQQNGL